MKKRLITAIALLATLIITLGLVQGFETLPNYVPLLPPFIAIAAVSRADFIATKVLSAIVIMI